MTSWFGPSALLMVMIIPVVIGWVMHAKFLKMLRENHREKWEELGSPALFSNNGIHNGIDVLMFLFKKKYVLLGDGSLTKFAGILRAYYLVYILLFVAVMVLFFYVFQSGH